MCKETSSRATVNIQYKIQKYVILLLFSISHRLVFNRSPHIDSLCLYFILLYFLALFYHVTEIPIAAMEYKMFKVTGEYFVRQNQTRQKTL